MKDSKAINHHEGSSLDSRRATEQLADKERHLKQMEQDYLALVERVSLLNAELAASQGDCARLRAMLVNIEQYSQSAISYQRSLNHELRVSQDQFFSNIRALYLERQQMAKHVLSAGAEYQKLRQQNSVLKELLEQSKTLARQELARAEEQWKRNVAAVSKQLEEVAAQASKKEQLMKHLIDECEEQSLLATTMRGNTCDLQQSLLTLRGVSAIQEQKLKEAREKDASQEARLQQCSSRLEVQGMQVATLSKTNEKLQKRVQELEEEVRNLKQGLQSNETLLSCQRGKVAEAELKLRVCEKDRRAGVAAAAEQAQKQKEQYEQALGEAGLQLVQAQNQKQGIRRQLQQVRQKLRMVEEQGRAAERMLSEARQAAQSRKKQLFQTRGELKSQKESQSSMRNRMLELEGKLAEQSQLFDELKSQSWQYEQKMKQFEKCRLQLADKEEALRAARERQEELVKQGVKSEEQLRVAVEGMHSRDEEIQRQAEKIKNLEKSAAQTRHLGNQLQIAEVRCKDLESELLHTKQDLAALQSRRLEESRQAQSHQEQHQHARYLLKEKERLLLDKDRRLAQLAAEREAADNELRVERVKQDKLSDTNKLTVDELTRKIKALGDSNARLVELQSKLEAEVHQLGQARRRLEESEEQLRLARRELKSKSQQLLQLQAARAKLLQNESQLLSALKDREQLQQRLEEAADHVQSIQSNCQRKAEQFVSSLAARLSDLGVFVARAQDFNSLLGLLGSEFAVLKQSARQAEQLRRKLSDKEATLQQHCRRLADSETELELARSQLKSVEEALGKLKVKLAETKALVEEFQQKREQAEILRIRTQTEWREKELRSQHDRLEQEAQTSALQKELRWQVESRDKAERRSAQIAEQSEARRRQLNQCEGKLRSALAELSDLREKEGQLKEQRKRLEDSAEKSRAEARQKALGNQEELAFMNRRLSEAQQHLRQVQQAVRSAAEQQSISREILAGILKQCQYETHCTSLVAESYGVKLVVQRLQTNLGQLRIKVAEMEQHQHSLKSKVSQAELKENKLLIACSILKEQQQASAAQYRQEVQRLKAQAVSLQQSGRKLSEQKSKAQLQAVEVDKQRKLTISRLESEIVQLGQLNRTMAREARQSLQKSNQELSMCRGNESRLAEEMARLKRQLERAQLQGAAHKQRVEELLGSKQELLQTMRQFEGQEEELRNKLIELSSKLDAATRNADSLASLMQARDEHQRFAESKAIIELARKEEALYSATDQLSKLRSQLKRVGNLFFAKESQCEVLQAKNLDLMDRLRLLQGQRSDQALRQRALDQRATETEGKLSSLVSDIKSLLGHRIVS